MFALEVVVLTMMSETVVAMPAVSGCFIMAAGWLLTGITVIVWPWLALLPILPAITLLLRKVVMGRAVEAAPSELMETNCCC